MAATVDRRVRASPWILLISLHLSCSIAWVAPDPYHQSPQQQQRIPVGCGATTVSPMPTADYSSNASLHAQAEPCSPLVVSEPLTTALLLLSYDGAHFTGWSAANQQQDDEEEIGNSEPTTNNTSTVSSFRPSRRRRRRLHANNMMIGKRHHAAVRSVEGVLQKNLAKIYGNVNPERIVTEGCSRTDKGVHARHMVAQFYCLKKEHSHNETTSFSSFNTIPGKKKPHPASSVDSTCFEPLPFVNNDGNDDGLEKIMYVLNRMLPFDVRVRAIAPVPSCKSAQESKEEALVPFHPTLDAVSKTYQYTFSVGNMYDPLQSRYTWQHVVEGGDDDDYDMWDVEEVRRVARDLLVGRHDFAAFRGAPRGKSDKRRQEMESTMCCLKDVNITARVGRTFPGVTLTTYQVTVTGDRFLYKMVRFLVGALVAVGMGKLTYQDVERALETGQWNSADGTSRQQFTCAPPHGLILTHVEYEQCIHWTTSGHRTSKI